VRARKRAVEVQVTFADSDGLLQTREGPVHFVRGDALLTGAANDRWPVELESFLRTYEPVPPTRPGEMGRYRKRPLTVWARRMDGPFSVRVGRNNDALTGCAGDWLVQYGPGEYGVVSGPIFESSYDLLDGQPKHSA